MFRVSVSTRCDAETKKNNKIEVETDCVDFKHVTVPIQNYTHCCRYATLWHVCIVPDECHDSTDREGWKPGGGRGGIRYVSIKPLIWVSVLLFNIYIHANKWSLRLLLFSFIISFYYCACEKHQNHTPPLPHQQTLPKPRPQHLLSDYHFPVFYNLITVHLNYRWKKYIYF